MKTNREISKTSNKFFIVKYKLIDRKIDFNLQGGLVTNLMVGNKVILMQDGNAEPIGSTGSIRKFNYLGAVGFGIEYPLYKSLAFSIEPRFRYYLNSIDKSDQINVHPYSLGVFAGFTYVF